MTVGNHTLTGTVQPLKDPFCLMEKKYAEEAGQKTLQAYNIIGVVKQKYLFNSYPKVIMRWRSKQGDQNDWEFNQPKAILRLYSLNMRISIDLSRVGVRWFGHPIASYPTRTGL